MAGRGEGITKSAVTSYRSIMSEQRGVGSVRDDKFQTTKFIPPHSESLFGRPIRTGSRQEPSLHPTRMSVAGPLVRPTELSGPRFSHISSRNVESLYSNDNSRNMDYGRDSNRLDYFNVTAFDVYENEGIFGIASYGGGGGSRQMSVGMFAEKESSVSNGMLVQRSVQKRTSRGVGGSKRSIGGVEGGRQVRWWMKCWVT